MRLSLFALYALGFSAIAPARAALVEDIIEVPVTVRTIYSQTVTQNITVTIWHDDARSKSPFLVLNHGRPANAEGFAKMGRQRYSANSAYFVAKGFAVLVPTRIGYGPSGGTDVEYSGSCAARNYPPVYRAAAEQTLAVLERARTLPYVDVTRGIVVGQSYGGAIALALASLGPPGVVAAVNFAGGGGGNPETSPERPCRPDLIEKLFADYGRTAKMPSLWLYSDNDRYFGKVYPKRWFEAYVASGAPAEFVALPAYGTDGHPSFTRNPAAWKPAFENFLRKNGF